MDFQYLLKTFYLSCFGLKTSTLEKALSVKVFLSPETTRASKWEVGNLIAASFLLALPLEQFVISD